MEFLQIFAALEGAFPEDLEACGQVHLFQTVAGGKGLLADLIEGRAKADLLQVVAILKSICADVSKTTLHGNLFNGFLMFRPGGAVFGKIIHGAVAGDGQNTLREIPGDPFAAFTGQSGHGLGGFRDSFLSKYGNRQGQTQGQDQ